jgi:hypothetical protein
MDWFVLGVMERANKTGLGDVAGVSSTVSMRMRKGQELVCALGKMLMFR